MSYGYTSPQLAPVPQQGQALGNLEPAYVEEIRKCVNNGKLTVSIEGIYTLIRNKITVGRGKNQTITPMDVITVLKTAVSAGLDPTSDDVFAFKTDDRTIVGISKKGWSKIVDTRKASVSYEYGPTIPARGIKQPSRFEWISVTIKKHDGSEVTGPRVYSDEFDQGRGVWNTNPKSMLAVRAFTHACAIAFGIGAYDEDEARSIFTKSEGRPPYNEQAQILPQEPAQQAAVAFEQAGNISELNKAFNALPLQKRQNPSTVEAFKQAKGRLINATTSTPQLESASND